MEVKLVESDAAVGKVVPVLLQLRNQFTAEDLVRRIEEQRAGGYRLAYVEAGGKVLCVAGFVVGTKLAWGRHLYVDDLVTAEESRSRGAGACMIDWLKRHAREQGCGQIQLDSGVQRFAAHRFYLRHGFDITSHHFSIKL